MSMSKWIGYAVSVNCGSPLGCYQGTILEADGGTITLTKAFRNGFPYPKSQVTLNAADIKELKIIEAQGEGDARTRTQTHSTVALTKSNKKCQRATVCENLQANPSNSSSVASGINKGASSRSGIQGAPPPRSKPIEIQGNRTNKSTNPSGSYGAGATSGSTPRATGARGGPPQHAAARRRNEACFGTDTTDPAFDEEFDFEKNLALFDKQALWEQMRNSHKPDLVRSTDEKFRHDENVLGGPRAGPAATRAIRVPDEARGPLDYVSDDGVIVPSVCGRVRRALWEAMQRCGLLDAALLLLARAAADVALRLVGGGRRLDPRNAHQVPTVVALVGPHRMGACGLQAARLLASHGVRTAALVCGAAGDEVARDLALFTQCGGRVCARADELPSPDLVLLAAHDPARPEDDTRHYSEALQWARSARAGVVCVEPGECEAGPGGGVAARASVVALLPPALHDALGRLYLADVAPPQRIFSELRLTYKPPFGAASVLALHPNDE